MRGQSKTSASAIDGASTRTRTAASATSSLPLVSDLPLSSHLVPRSPRSWSSLAKVPRAMNPPVSSTTSRGDPFRVARRSGCPCVITNLRRDASRRAARIVPLVTRTRSRVLPPGNFQPWRVVAKKTSPHDGLRCPRKWTPLVRKPCVGTQFLHVTANRHRAPPVILPPGLPGSCPRGPSMPDHHRPRSRGGEVTSRSSAPLARAFRVPGVTQASS